MNLSPIDNKYDYEKNIDDNEVKYNLTTYAKIINWIEDSSSVLEIGPYKGRLTRYLKDRKKCNVFVIEMDPEAYSEVITIADEGYCGNVETIDMKKVLGDRKFDYVVLMDVMEHLYNPSNIILNVKKYIKDTGEILFSVPNIAHADVIMNLLQDRFQYTKVGLLDNTHVHFFSRNSVLDLINDTDLLLLEEDCTIVEPFSTEQGEYIKQKNHYLLEQIMTYHKMYGVYQFVCRTSKIKKNKTISHIEDRISDINSRSIIKLYVDMGMGVSENDVVYVPQNNYVANHLEYSFNIPEGCVGIRFDPLDNQQCIVRRLVCKCNGIKKDVENINGIHFANNDIFITTDPQFFINIDNDEKTFEIECDIEPITFGNVESLLSILIEQDNVINTLKKDIIDKKSINEICSQQMQLLQNINKLSENSLKALEENNYKVDNINQYIERKKRGFFNVKKD